VIRSLLLDLDDTLLKNDIDTFLPAYLQRLGAFVNDLVPAERFIPQLLQATRAMVDNTDPERTLESVFAASFYPALGMTEEELSPRFEEFYRTEFPRLRSLTGTIPEAGETVRQAEARGLEVVVATNPLFPLTAIEQRLEWAGVPVHEHSYALVTSFESIHFTKSWPAYYAEVLALVGLHAWEAAMVGDNVEADLAPARLLGMAVYHNAAEPEVGYPGGLLKDVLPWLEHQSDFSPSLHTLGPEAILAVLTGDLAAIRTLASRITGEGWRVRSSSDGWSPVESLCHLRDAEIEVNLPRLEQFQSQASPSFSAADTDSWAIERDYQSQSPEEALSAFTRARKELLTRLAALCNDEWSRPARHSLLGPTTLSEIVSLIAEHERLHLGTLRTAPHRQSASP
jgi:FMN phosphatase YigB (HAD superfamily)